MLDNAQTEAPEQSSAPGLVYGLPPRYFTDADIFARIRDRIFYKTWQFACHSSQVAAPGDYFCFSIMHQDVCVLRGHDQQLRAFFNVCQHRGHPLLEGQGNKSRLVCPYHAWCYDLNGDLLAVPNAAAVTGFDKTQIKLRPVRVEQFAGFVFVNLDDDCAPMGAWYPGALEELMRVCPDMEARKLAHEHAVDEGCGWLTAVENYNECYHCKVAHKAFASGVVQAETYCIEPLPRGYSLRHTARGASGETAWHDAGESEYLSIFLWPTTGLQLYPGGMLNTYHWRPLCIDDTRVYRSWYSPDGAFDSAMQTVATRDRETTFAEDLRLVRQVQRGLHNFGYRPGPLIVDPQKSIDNETSIAQLHKWLREAVD